MASSTDTNKSCPVDDDDLDQLLQSALNDFDQTPGKDVNQASTPSSSSQQTAQTPSAKKSKGKKGKGNKTSPLTGNLAPDGLPPLDPAMMGHVDEVFKNMLGSDPILKEHWDKLTESCSKAADAKTDEDFEASLNETLKNLTENAQSLINNGPEGDVPDDELARMLSQLGMGSGDGGDPSSGGGILPDIMPMITQMMQNLLSKDILYPALKDLTNKYPGWLESNKESLSDKDLERYARQLDLMRNVCYEFEGESEEDSTEDKQKRFQSILSTMQAMQELGPPPKDLVGDVPEGSGEADLQKIFSSLPGADGNPQCCIQ